LIVPLQIGLAVQMHHTFGSRFLIDNLNSCGFSSSYSDIFKLSGKYSRFFSIDSISETNGYSFLALSIDFMSDLIKLAGFPVVD
jgi:hypothetical protein